MPVTRLANGTTDTGGHGALTICARKPVTLMVHGLTATTAK